MANIKTRGSNFGTRIDCYAWGENVTTTYSDWNPGSNSYTTDSYTSGFSGTSSAAAIVAGAALSVQAMAQAALGFRFSPAQLRAILRDRTAGVPGRLANTASDDLIGVMPNLAYISQAVLRIAPDIYIRDFLGDTGDPHLGAISCSPDVIVRNAIEPDPQAAFGAGSGNENNDALGSDVIAGQDNFIYVRVLNRGGSAAANVEATVYWSPVATLVTPNLWTLVGSTNLPNVPVNSLTVSDAIKWTSANIPAAGHYCFVALVGNNADPAPDRAEFRNWTNYENFIRNNNNVTWRNFNVVVPMMKKRRLVGRSRYAEFPFLATGTPEKARKMGLAIVARLPEGARVLLEGPASFLDGFSGKVLPENDLSAKIKMMPINPLGRHDLGEAIFPAWSRTPLRLLVHVPDEARGNTYQIHVSQFFEGLEVGRVTWRLTGDGEKNARKE